MIAIPLIDLLEVLIYWALRFAILPLILIALHGLSGGGRAFGWLVRLIRNGLEAIVHNIEQGVASAALGVEAGVVNFLVGAAHRIDHYAWSGWYTAARTGEAFEHLVSHAIPRYVRGVVHPVDLLAHAAWRLAHAIAHDLATELPKLWRHAHTIERTIVKVPQVAKAAAAGAVPYFPPLTIPWTNEQVGYTRKQLARVLRKIRALPDWLTTAGVAGVAVYALGKIRAEWLHCNNWRKIGHAGCRSPSRWLDELLGLATDFAIVSNVCLVIPWIERAALEVGQPLVAILTRAGAGLCRGSAGAPETLTPPALILPPAQGLTLHLY